jgi:hypothetical protein
MSRGAGRLERAIVELFLATEDRALSVGDICDYAFKLGGRPASRAQRLSATRAAHRLLHRAAAALAALETTFEAAVDEASTIVGRGPGGRGRSERVLFFIGNRIVGVDEPFAEVMKTTRHWAAYDQAWSALDREKRHYGGKLPDWRATELPGRRLYFHAADYPVRVWAVAINEAGVIWVEVDKIVSVDGEWVKVLYRGEPARLSREKLRRSWTLFRNVYFASSQTGYAARMFDKIWQDQYGRRDWYRAGGGVPLQAQMSLAEAATLLGVPSDFTREDVIAAFRCAAKKAHPDVGGSAELFRKLVIARDRLLAAIGTSAPAPKMPEFAPKGIKLHYGKVRFGQPPGAKIGHTRRIARA